MESDRIYIARHNGIVLALLPGNKVTPYVTWAYDQKNLDTTYWGHYHKDFGAAVEDYRVRAGFDANWDRISLGSGEVSIFSDKN